MAKPIIIFGTGGNCVDILDTIQEINRAAGTDVYDCLGFLDDDRSKHGTDIFGVRVLGALSTAEEYSNAVFVNGIGSPLNFKKKQEIIATAGVDPERFETLVHPTASVSRMSVLGRGVVVLQNATIASNVQICDHVIILPNSIVSHDAKVGSYSSIAGGVCISGGVTIGESAYIGTNSAIRGSLNIGDRALIGMGSVVIRDIQPDQVVAGNPAREI